MKIITNISTSRGGIRLLLVKYLIAKLTFIIMFILIATSCSKMVEVDTPVNSLTSQNIYSTDATSVGVLNGLYSNLFNYSNYTSAIPAVSADELTLYNLSDPNYSTYYRNAILPTSLTFWSNYYNYIFGCNAAIEGISSLTTLTPVVKQQLMGEAKFLRAYSYFYLANFFGDVPLVTTTDYTKNSLLARTSKANIFLQIITDLKDAQNLLSLNFLDASLLKVTTERVRPTKWAATALLARVYLYQKDWKNAEDQATSVISDKPLFDTVPLNKVFLKNSAEAIWQLQPVNSGSNTIEATLYLLPVNGPNNSNPLYLSSNLFNSFGSGDLRSTNWVGTVMVAGKTFYFPNKYKKNVDFTVTTTAAMTEYEMVLRLGEQYLIKAEAMAQQDNISGAQIALNIIRTRAGLPSTTANDKASLLKAILDERRKELFTEWGHRWLDLIRTASVDSILGSPGNICQAKGGTWSSNWQLYPIPNSELQKDPNLTQNLGY